MSKPLYTSAAEAEAAFYDAIARADLDAMMAVWSEDDDVVCIHPGSGRLTGLAEVRESWRGMFASGARLTIRTSHQVASTGLMLAIHNVLEHLTTEDQGHLLSPQAATNVYARGALGWRMVMRHASPLPNLTALLDRNAPQIVH